MTIKKLLLKIFFEFCHWMRQVCPFPSISCEYNITIDEIKKKIPDYDKYFTTQGFNKLTSESFVARLKHVANFVKKTDFVKKLVNINKTVTSKKKEKPEKKKYMQRLKRN